MKEWKKDYKKFFQYFETQWIKKVDISEWNLYELALNALNTNTLDKIFFTNNIVESCNSRLNSVLIKNKNNTVNNFNKTINKIINLYFANDTYNPRVFSKKKAISYYFIKVNNISEDIKLINN